MHDKVHLIDKNVNKMFICPPNLIMAILFVPDTSNAIAFETPKTGTKNAKELGNVTDMYTRIALI